MALQQHTLVDKTMMVVLGFLVVGIPIAFLQPDTGELRDQPLYLLFYASIGGIIVVIMYNGYKGKKADNKLIEREEENLRNNFYISKPKDSATSANFWYCSRYCLPFGVITNTFLPSYSILLTSPAPVKLLTNFSNLECEGLPFKGTMVFLFPPFPLYPLSTKGSATFACRFG